MAFDKDRHEFDKRGFMVEKDTKEVAGQKERWLEKHEHHGSEYPKWVKPHKDHVIEVHGNKVAPNHEFAIDRDSKEVAVKVHDATEEEKVKRGHHRRHEEPEEEPKRRKK